MRRTGAASGWTAGLSWNVAALGVAGVSGLAANAAIANSYGPAGLGVFSQTLTWFALSAQVAALGVHYAVLRGAATSGSTGDARRSVESGLGAVIVIASITAVASYALAPLVAEFVASPPMRQSIRLASLALLLHAAAKVVAAGLNGMHRMRAFSAVSASRGIGLLLAGVGFPWLGLPVSSIGAAFIVSEALALGVGVAAWGRLAPDFRLDRLRPLIAYGARAAGAAVTVEANARVDVAVLGVLATDRVVGIYALAATFYEGALQLFVVLRNQVNSSISNALGRRAPEEVDALQRKLRGWTAVGSLALLLGAGLTFGQIVALLGLSSDFMDARAPLLILLGGLVVSSPWLPFDQLLVVGGEPGAQSRAVAWSMATNVAANMLLVPVLGGVGAAIGTSVALAVLALGVATRGRRLLGTSFGLPSRRGSSIDEQ